ncbi:MAG: hypothetical protein R2710_14380 [Acidimicrobiales bacterium]
MSDQSSVFTFTSQRIRYYTLTDSYTGANNVGGQLGRQLFQRQLDHRGWHHPGGQPGQMLTFNNVTRNSVITATAPLSGSGLGNATDSIVPESYADTEFIFPTKRNVQTIWVRSVRRRRPRVPARHHGDDPDRDPGRRLGRHHRRCRPWRRHRCWRRRRRCRRPLDQRRPLLGDQQVAEQ